MVNMCRETGSKMHWMFVLYTITLVMLCWRNTRSWTENHQQSISQNQQCRTNFLSNQWESSPEISPAFAGMHNNK